MARTQVVSIDAVIADSRCQSRTGIDLALVHEYAEAIREGAELPPLSTIDAEQGYYVYDGFHRLEAYRQAGTTQVVIEADPGDVWDAIERSCAVNAVHGKRRTNADKHRAVETMLKVMEHKGKNWTDSEIARRCAVSSNFVGTIRPHLSSDERYKDTPRTAVRNGKTYEMNTANIGKRSADPAPPMDPGPELVDEETGEILDEVIPYEEADPSDPVTWFTPATSKPAATPAARSTAPRAFEDTLTFTNYGPDYEARTAASIAETIRITFGDAFAERVARELQTGDRGVA